MKKRRIALAMLAVVLAATLLPRAERAARLAFRWGDYAGYNLVLVTLDTTRDDFLEAADRSGGAFAGLAKEGIDFRTAVAPSTTTVPSHASILTGVYPSEHGVIHNALSLDTAWVSMAEIFRDAGYRTAAFLSARGILSRNLAQGFGVVDDEVPDGLPLRWQRPGRVTNERVARWLDTGIEGHPFFLWVHYYDPHSPMDVPDDARRLMPEYDGPFRDGLSVDALGDYGDARPLTAADLRFLRILYAHEIGVEDDALGGLVGMLRSRGFWDRTVLVIVGDHGQSLGEKAYVGHDGPLLHEPLVHVPFLMRTPPAPRGGGAPNVGLPWTRRSVETPVGLCDVLPTVLDLFGDLRPPSYALAGRSLLPRVLRFRSGYEKRPVFVEAPGEFGANGVEPRENFAVRDGRWKLVARPEGSSLYDLVDDPDEERPLPPGSAPERRMTEFLRAWRASVSRPRGAAGDEIDPETRRALEALGYVDAAPSR